MPFLDENYLLTNESAKKIFKQIKDLPIIDAHNHSDVVEIQKNQNYSDIWFVEAATDHYVWELLRKRGIEEKFITGDAIPKEKFLKMASVFEEIVGNPVYEWVHLDLKRQLGINLLINEENAEQIWNQSQEILQNPEMTPQALLNKMNVEVMCSTDDPVDLLKEHKKLKENSDFKTEVLPTWRPDNAMKIFKPNFPRYIKKLEERVDNPIHSIDDLVSALKLTHDYFDKVGARASDHGIEIPFGYKVDKEVANRVLQKRLKGELLTTNEVKDFMSYMLHQFGKMNAESEWVMQIHIGAVRDIRKCLYENLGPDSGGDVSNHLVPILEPLNAFLNEFDGKLNLILYVLDPNHLPTIATLARAFGENVSLGAPWWFNDSPIGMKRQLEYIASVDLLMNFAGMVSDSRKLISYGSRTEMFRRVLSDVLGKMVEKGQMPLELATRCAKYVSYERKKELFEF